MADRPHEATLVFDYDDPAVATHVAGAVAREVGEIDGDRTTATVTRDGATVEVAVVADDLVGLRAGLNTWTGLVEVAESVAAPE